MSKPKKLEGEALKKAIEAEKLGFYKFYTPAPKPAKKTNSKK